jgi:hypothetical protein
LISRISLISHILLLLSYHLIEFSYPSLALIQAEFSLLFEIFKFGAAIFPVGPNSLNLCLNALLLLEKLLLKIFEVTLNTLFISFCIFKLPLMIHFKLLDLLLMVRQGIKTLLLHLIPIKLCLRNSIREFVL